MHNLWLFIAACIELFGTVIILAHVIQAGWVALRRGSIEKTKSIVAIGAIAGLDFKMGATLLKAISLFDWPQIGKFAVILFLRVILKSSFRRERDMS